MPTKPTTTWSQAHIPRRLSVDELLDHGDMAFVQLAYRSILGREADEAGLANYVTQLRRGISKAEVVTALAASSEAQLKKSTLAGLDDFLKQNAPRNTGRDRFRSVLRRILGVDELMQSTRLLDNHLYRVEGAVAKLSAELGSVKDGLLEVRQETSVAQSVEPTAEPDVSELLAALRAMGSRSSAPSVPQ